MSLYTETGAINVVSNDTTKGRYSPTGALRINLVSGTAYTGLYADDGALNVVDVSGVSSSTYGGLYHPCGAIRARTALDTFTGLYAPDGSYYFNGLFSPLNLFSQGEQGVWYDPSDFSTLFQDAAGTTPVTAVEQPVGLMLDKSKGLVLGSELVTNGTFDTDVSGWAAAGVNTGDDVSFAWNNGAILITRGADGIDGRPYQSFTTKVGSTYRVTITETGSGPGVAAIRPTLGASSIVANTNLNAATWVVHFVATTTTTFFELWTAVNSSARFDNISVRELPGNHASQSSDLAARPVLSARVNLLTKTEQFDDAVWTKINSTVTANAAIAPDGTTTADLLIETVTTSIHRVSQSAGTLQAQTLMASIRYKTGVGTRNLELAIVSGANFVSTVFNPSTGVVIVNNDNVGSVFSGKQNSVSGPDAQGFYTATITVNLLSAQSVSVLYGLASGTSNNYLGDGTSGIYIWGADLRVSNVGVNLPAYQRVNTSTDYDTTGFPYYLKFDGSDDWMVTGTINPGSVDKAQVFAGVRKLSDAATGAIFEWSASAAINLSTFALHAPNTITGLQYRLFTRDSNAIDTNAGPSTGFAAPITNVASGQIDIAGASQILRLNGAVAGSSSSSLGSGNWPAYPLYIGRRGGTTLPFNGQLYSLIVRFSATNLPDATIAQTETWVSGKTALTITPTFPVPNNLIWGSGDNLIWDSGNNITWGTS